MDNKILVPSRYPVARIPVFSGGASGEVFCADYDPAYGEGQLYFAPFAVATKPETFGQEKLEERGIRVLVHPRADGMTFKQWTDGLVDVIEGNLPAPYTMNEVLVELTGCDLLLKGEKVERAIGPRKMNVHPAPLYVLTHPETGKSVDAYGLLPEDVQRRFIDEGYERRYVGWGEDIMGKILQERHEGASTVHIATPQTDHGPNIAVRHMQREPGHLDDAGLFQDALKQYGDGPTLVAGTHMIIRGLQLDGNTLTWKREALPYQGHELGEDWEAELGIDRLRRD